ncbi:MAG TPA: YajD family HNH nuclease [Syntrophales bacterium]|nr:YajD family HNH nuclease [Syntrophales bacterium]
MKRDLQKPPGEDYREKSLAIHGLICARCAREFDESNRHLLTVHHKDGNHMNNPLDGSNWENLCVYCHEDIHGRGLLGDFFDGSEGRKEEAVVYTDDKESSEGVLGKKLVRALREKEEKKRRR